MRVPWDMVPATPVRFMRGIIDPLGGKRAMHAQYELTLERAVQLFAEQLPASTNSWAMIHDKADRRLLAYVRREKGEAWDGCKAAFDELAKIHSPEEVAWWATMAENYDLQG